MVEPDLKGAEIIVWKHKSSISVYVLNERLEHGVSTVNSHRNPMSERRSI